MPSRRLRVARRFWSSSRALSCGRSAGGTAWPGREPERVQRVGALLGVAQLGDRLRVVAGDLEEPGGRRDRGRRGADLEREPERLGATAPAPPRWWRGDAPCRCGTAPRGRTRSASSGSTPSRRTRRAATSSTVGHLEPHGAHAGSDRGDEVGLARRAEDPHGALGRLLELLEQEVRGLLGHAVGVLDDDDPVPSDGRRVVRAAHDLAHVVALDDDALGASTCRSGWLRASTWMRVGSSPSGSPAMRAVANA